MSLRRTGWSLSALLIAMVVATFALVVLSVSDAIRGRAPHAVFLSVYAVCALILCGGMFVGAIVVWKVQRQAPHQRLFALATPAERVLWLGGAVGGFFLATTLLILMAKGNSLADALQPIMIGAIALPSIAIISAGRRVLTAVDEHG